MKDILLRSRRIGGVLSSAKVALLELKMGSTKVAVLDRGRVKIYVFSEKN